MVVETEKNVGDKVYFLKKTSRIKCEGCDGTGRIHLTKHMNMDALVRQFAQNCTDVAIGNVREYDCPKCHGKGTVRVSLPKYEVVRGTVVGIEYSRIGFDMKLIYHVTDDNRVSYKLTDNHVWLAEDAAQRKCDFLNLERRIVPIGCIQIPHCFATTIPCNEKLMRRLDEWRSARNFKTEIYVDENMNLFDGYTSYLVYRMFGQMDVPVVIWPKEKKP